MSELKNIIDAHVHLHGTKYSADEIASWAKQYGKAFGVDFRMALIPFGPTWAHYPEPKEVSEMHETLARYLEAWPELFYGWAYVNPADVDFSIKEIDKWIANGPFIGVKLWIAKKCSDPSVQPILERCAELGVPVLQHAWDKASGQLPDESRSSDVAIAARNVPRCKIIMAHLAGFWQRGIKEIAPYPNVYVDCSGGWALSGAIDKAVDLLGVERVIFASDAPVRDVPSMLGKVLAASLGKENKRKILAKNFLALIKRKVIQ